MATLKNYYAGANSSIGFFSLYDEVFSGLDKLYILKGGPGSGKSTFMRKIGLKLMEVGLDLKYYHCAADNQSLDGIIIPQLKTGFVDGTYPHIVDPKYPGLKEKIIDFGIYTDDTYLEKNRKELIKLTNEVRDNLDLAYHKFGEARKIHLEKVKFYKNALDFSKLDETSKGLCDLIFKNVVKEEGQPKVKRHFFGAATPKGIIHFIDNITADLTKRFIIRGRPGSGKSTVMKQVGKKAENLGLNVEYFPCGFDPTSIDMVIIPKLSVCIVDGSEPHIVDPFRDNDQIIDMFSLCTDSDIEKGESGKRLQELTTTYKMLMVKGTNYLSEAKRLQDNLKDYYSDAMDFKAISQKREEILDEILFSNKTINN